MLLSPAATHQAPPEQEKAFQALLQQLESAALAEPLLLGLDTRIRAAAQLRSRRPQEALAFLARAEQAAFALDDSSLAAYAQLRIVKVLTLLDPEEALRLAARIPTREKTGAQRDYKAEAYEALTSHWLNRSRSRAIEIAMDGLLAGAFRNRIAGSLLTAARAEDSAAARELYARLLAGFPRQPLWQDVWFLIEASRNIAPLDPLLAGEGAQQAFTAIQDGAWNVPGFSFVEQRGPLELSTTDARRALLRQLEQLLSALPPTLRTPFTDRLTRLRAQLPEMSMRQLPPGAGGSPSQRLLWRAGNPDFPEDSTSQEASLSPDEDLAPSETPLPEQQAYSAAWDLLSGATSLPAGDRHRAAMLQEAVRLALRLPASRRRIEILRRVLLAAQLPHEDDLAAPTCRLLAESTASWCRCDQERCPGGGGRPACLELYQQLLEDLRVPLRHWPAAFAVDPSLRARILLARLDEAIPAAARSPSPAP